MFSIFLPGKLCRLLLICWGNSRQPSASPFCFCGYNLSNKKGRSIERVHYILSGKQGTYVPTRDIVSTMPLHSDHLWDHLWARRVEALVRPMPNKAQMGQFPFYLATYLLTAFAPFSPCRKELARCSHQAMASYILSRNLSILVAPKDVLPCSLPFRHEADLPQDRLSHFALH